MAVIVAIGVDTLAIARIERLLARVGERFLARVYTDAERAYCRARHRPAAALTARFCAKEAVAKCLGTGIGNGVAFRHIEVVRDPAGPVAVALFEGAFDAARRRGIARIHLSMSHDETAAVAFAVAES